MSSGSRADDPEDRVGYCKEINFEGSDARMKAFPCYVTEGPDGTEVRHLTILLFWKGQDQRKH